MLIGIIARRTQVARNTSNQQEPTRLASAVHAFKVAAVTARRLVQDTLDPTLTRHQKLAHADTWPVVAESISPIWTNEAPGEWELEAGKVENLRQAARLLDGLVIPAGDVFSFWAQIGRPTRRRGFVEGREILQGCVVPSVGGGLCQLSNALYDAAQRAGFEIVERHRHSKIVPGSMAEQDRDATVFWPHIDLRFRSERTFKLEARLTRDAFVIRLRALGTPVYETPAKTKPEPHEEAAQARPNTHKNCLNCHKVECFRYWKHRKLARKPGARTAFLLDSHWPEFDAYISQSAQRSDFACIPLPGRALRNPRYAWRLDGVHDVRHVLGLTALRGLHTRALRAQGAERQQALLDWDRALAQVYAQHLDPRVTRVVVSQNLLPFLWQAGHLQGRHVDVLVTRFPVAELHRRLDAAAKIHPQSPTLGDFRAPEALAEAEDAALAYADKLITPHSAIAELFPRKSVHLAWHLPQAQPRSRRSQGRPTIVFAASTVGRKGAYELREALRGLDVDLRILGRELEGDGFWAGHRTSKCGEDWLRDADAVVLPAHVEHQPRVLLEAAAANIPVFASRACGLGGVDGVEEVPVGDADALRAAIVAHLELLRASSSAA
ncbi:glycosyltransferase [Persicimonas caeni]|uniref:Glycosyltransferase n=1 Tax=Persicimonas caeni TaxID=2292766 RepID=A0A4Y6PMB1_PERCE|nr:glycosyltransferase [Persicimonas caeni]QED30659.1 glycosyltransferase [Persicimonas caeni]